jgi:hypothetical protein
MAAGGLAPLCFVLMPFGVKTDGVGRTIDFDRVYRDILQCDSRLMSAPFAACLTTWTTAVRRAMLAPIGTRWRIISKRPALIS